MNGSDMCKNCCALFMSFLFICANFAGFFNSLCLDNFSIAAEDCAKLFFCTSADNRHFPLLLNLIGSIHKLHDEDLGEIAIFDLGFDAQQRNRLCTIEKVQIYDVELTHPDLLKHLPRFIGATAKVRGLYAWKPVAIKQALDMFPYIMYLDAGIILRRPFNDVFKHIKQHGYFFVDCGGNILCMTTKYLIDKFDLTSSERCWILDEDMWGLSGGFQGLTRAMYDCYVLPMYELSKDLKNFIDDGSAAGGRGKGRHDQALFSILARLQGLTVSPREGGAFLDIDGNKIPFRAAERYHEKDTESYIVIARWQRVPDYSQYIRYKPGPLDC